MNHDSSDKRTVIGTANVSSASPRAVGNRPGRADASASALRDQLREALDAWAAGDRSLSDDKQAYAALGLLLDGPLSDILELRGTTVRREGTASPRADGDSIRSGETMEEVWWCANRRTTFPPPSRDHEGRCFWCGEIAIESGCGPRLLIQLPQQDQGDANPGDSASLIKQGDDE